MTITEFIEVNLGRIEQAARDATPGPWSIIGFGEYVSGVGIVVAPDDGGVTSADAAHIAANDPTHVLAWVAAIRAVVDACTRSVWAVGESGSYLADAILAHVAAIFADQPGYDEEWR